jgi:hypothetical protein
MDAVERIKRKLFLQLQGWTEFVGTGIKEKKGKEYVVVQLAEANEKIASIIPKEVDGVEVEVEITGTIKAF